MGMYKNKYQTGIISSMNTAFNLYSVRSTNIQKHFQKLTHMCVTNHCGPDYCILYVNLDFIFFLKRT